MKMNGSCQSMLFNPPLCGGYIDFDFSILNFLLKGRGLRILARSIVHSCYAYIKHRPVSEAAGMVCAIYGLLLIYSATLNPVTGWTARRKTCMYGCRDHSRLAAFVALQSDRLGIFLATYGKILCRQHSAAVSCVYALAPRAQRPACMAQYGRDKPAAG